STIPSIETEEAIPTHFREQMLGEWTREAVLAAVQAGSKSASLNGSRTTGTDRNRLGANGHGANGHISPFGSRTTCAPPHRPLETLRGGSSGRQASAAVSRLRRGDSTIRLPARSRW